MAPPSTEHLSDYLTIKKSHLSLEIRSILPWNACLEIICYAVDVSSDSNHYCLNALIDTITRLEVKASEFNAVKLNLLEYLDKEQEIYDIFVDSFVPQAQNCFTVITQAEKCVGDPFSNTTSLIRSIVFLTKILYSEQNPALKEVNMGLIFYLHVTWDILLQGICHGGIEDLLEDFKVVVNEVGNFTYSFFFPTLPFNITWFCVCMHVLLYKFYLLNTKIELHCMRFPFFPPISGILGHNVDIQDSLVVFKSLSTYFEYLMNHQLDFIHGVINDIKQLHDELLLVVCILEDVTLPQEREIDGVKECIFRMKEVVNEAKFLIETFVDKHFPLWYITIRLPNVLSKFEIFGKRLVNEIHQVLDLQLLEDCYPRESHQAKRDGNRKPREPPSIGHLSKYFTDKIFDVSAEIRLSQNWKGCLELITYAQEFSGDSFDDDILIIRRLDDLASELEAIPLVLEDGQWLFDKKLTMKKEYESMIFNVLFLCFLPRSLKYFTVPKRSSAPALKVQILAGFIHFLLRILTSEADHFQNEMQYASLQSSLHFLLAFLGDTPLQHAELQGVGDLLEEFEYVTNETGLFLYICFCNGERMQHDMYQEMKKLQNNALVDKFHLLNEKIKNHLIESSKFSSIVSANLKNRMTAAIDSLFIVESLLADIENLANRQMYLVDGIINQIQELNEELVSMRSFLKAVNLPHHIELHDVREVVVHIRDVTYEAQYIINSYVAEIFPTWYTQIRIPCVIQKLGVIGKRFEQIKKITNLRVGKDLNHHKALSQTMVTPAPMDETFFVGYRKERDRIMDELTNPSKRGRGIIGVIGMPGIGKTTLAKNVYNDSLIIKHFDKCTWCVVSQSYHKRRVLIDLVKGLTTKPDQDEILENKVEMLLNELSTTLNMPDNDIILDKEDELLVELSKTLKRSRYLIVIDDIWNSDFWNDFERYFPSNGNGSRILFTSRNQDVARKDSIICKLPLLSENQCWEMLKKKLFNKKDCPPQLVDSGTKIAAKCNGLPLLVVILAGILLNVEMEKSGWEKVEMSLDSYKGNSMEIVELSYTHLPNHLKLCFVYLGVFLQGREIPVQKLIWMWIAEGFIEKHEEKIAEELAQEYLRDLIARNLVLDATRNFAGVVKTCGLHDLVREMSLKKAQEENILTFIKDDPFKTYGRHQRLCINSASSAYSVPFSTHCRSFFGDPSDISLSLPQMKLLKVMELSRNPESTNYLSRHSKLLRIDVLVHLRYLVIDQLKKVPEQIFCGLVNLEFLRVTNDDFDTISLPLAIQKMEKLKHLVVHHKAEFGENCNSSFQNKFETLSVVKIKSIRDYEVLKCSPHLHKFKCESNFFIPDFGHFTELESLSVSFPRNDQFQTYSTSINFPSTLTKLTLCRTCLPLEKMSVLGTLPKLEVLKLRMHAFKGKEWETSEGEFSELRSLEITVPNLEEWRTDSSDHFPKLEHLVLNRCFKLHNIPIELGSITTLKMIQVYYCGSEASESAVQIEQQQHGYGNEDFKVMIKNKREPSDSEMIADFLDLEAREDRMSQEEIMSEVLRRQSLRERRK